MKERFWLGMLILWGLTSGCHEQKTEPAHAPEVHHHEHKPLHGGTPVELGQEEYHLELVLDTASGKMQAYVMDGELENFIRITNEAFEVSAKIPAQTETLTFKAVPNSATGEKVGDTSLFETQADWLKTTRQFDAVLKQIIIRGKTYESVPFNFPNGNDAEEKGRK